jgi:hypothetical protein
VSAGRNRVGPPVPPIVTSTVARPEMSALGVHYAMKAIHRGQYLAVVVTDARTQRHFVASGLNSKETTMNGW